MKKCIFWIWVIMFLNAQSVMGMTPMIDTIIVEPACTTLTLNTSATFTAIAYDNEGGTIATTFAWKCSNGILQPINDKVIYTATWMGEMLVQAFSGGKVGSSYVTVIEPYITDITIQPKDIVLRAGEPQIFTTRVSWSDNATRTTTINYSYLGGTIDNNGIFMATQTGIYKITAQADSKADSTNVTIIPDTLAQIEPIIKCKAIYNERININNLFGCQGYDKYGNEVSVSGEQYFISRNQPGVIKRWVGTTTSVLDTLLRQGVIKNNTNEMLFFEKGTFAVTAVKDAISGSKEFIVNFGYGQEDIISWKNYHLIDFDDNGNITISFRFPGYQEKIVTFQISNGWLKRFEEGSYFEKLQVVGWVHYKILELQKQFLQKIEREQFKELILIPLKEKFQPQHYGTITKSSITCDLGTTQFLVSLELYMDGKGYFHSEKEYITIDNITSIKFYKEKATFTGRKVEFSGKGAFYKTPKKFDMFISQPQEKQGTYTIIIYDMNGKIEKEIKGNWLGTLKMEIDGEKNEPLPPPLPPSQPITVKGGGLFTQENGYRASFQVIANKNPESECTGAIKYLDHKNRREYYSLVIESLIKTGKDEVIIKGKGEIKGVGTPINFTVEIIDGTPDHFTINIIDDDMTVIHSASGQLTGGSIYIQ